MNKDYVLDIDKYLTKDERKTLAKLNDKSNEIRETINDKEDPLNMTLTALFRKWATINMDTIIDITNFISNISNYRNYFDDIDETGQWYTGIQKILADFSKIIIENNRPIYLGITLIFLAFALFIVQITS